MWASYNLHKKIVEMLLQAGADKEAKRKVSSSSCLLQLSTGCNLVVAVIVTVVAAVSYVDKRYSVFMIIIITQ